MFRAAREPQSKRHIRNSYYVVGEGIFNDPGVGTEDPVEPSTPSTLAALRRFRFSRLGPEPGTTVTGRPLREALAEAMTPAGETPDSSHPAVPAGFTYLGQFVDHDLTLDATARDLEQDVTVDELVQGRSPALDLDSLYGRGPRKPQDRKFYGPDGVRLRTGRTISSGGPGDGVNDVPQRELDGFDLPRAGIGSSIGERRAALIPDPRNDENLAVAQIHCAFIRFHNKVVGDLAARGTDSAALFDTARELVVKHYQWMLRTDYLTRIVDDRIVDDVFHHGRRYLDVAPKIEYGDDAGAQDDTYRALRPGDTPTMPIEFSVAAFRLGHSMVREEYEWNRVFNSGQAPGTLARATLRLIFVFSATSGNFQPFPVDDDNPDAGRSERLPTNWIADLPRLFDFSETGRKELTRPADQFNLAKRIDTVLVDVLKHLPLGSFGARGSTVPDIERNLAFRNLTRANMLKLATGQEMAEFLKLEEEDRLTPEEIEHGSGGASLAGLSPEDLEFVRTKTPLWFYILREAEVRGDGRLTGVGGRIVAEVFHRAMEGSRHSIVRDPEWRPTLAVDQITFRMSDLLLYAFEGNPDLLNPLGVQPS
ncbi:heme peroxidase family protein [Streptomyces sp. NPDC050535]|uniref:heme peroxidase family protein n=1 Tax=Streptomyces sp. NPDC050535 TaxID=3365626 RepID=UPI0037BD3715